MILNKKIMETSIKERVKEFCAHKNISVREFEKRCKVSNGYFNNLKNGGIAYNKMLIILESFPELNADWLANGDGDMLKSNIELIKGDKIIQSVGRDNNGTMIGRTGTKFAGFPDYEKLKAENKKLQEQIRKQQEQIDRLINIIEKLTKKATL